MSVYCHTENPEINPVINEKQRYDLFVKVLVTQSPTLCDPMDCSPPGSLSMEFSRQEYWSELPFSSPGDLPDPGIKPRSPTLWADSILAELPGKPQFFNKKNLSSIHVLLATLKTYLHRLLFPKF